MSQVLGWGIPDVTCIRELARYVLERLGAEYISGGHCLAPNGDCSFSDGRIAEEGAVVGFCAGEEDNG